MFLILLIIFAGCGYSDDDREAVNETIISFGLMSIISSERSYALVDYADGTVGAEERNITGELVTQKIFKKCLQGQIYRQPENDCQGAGSVLDHWGAALLQFCPLNDNSCSAASPAGSEAFLSCQNDTTAGMTWQQGGFDILLEDHAAAFQEIYTEFPFESMTGVWRSVSDDPARASFYIFPPASLHYTLKTEVKYVLCGAAQ